jgi:Fe-S cluster biogenesis protein NfuA
MCEQCGCSGSETEKTFNEKVEEMIQIIKPMLQGHGGDIELVSIEDDNTVKVKLQGACSGCPGAQMTLKQGVERLMKERIPELNKVVAVN